MAINSGAINAFSINGTPTAAATGDSVTGRGFKSLATIVARFEYPTSVAGRGFSQSAQIIGGAIVDGSSFATVPSISYVTADTGYVTGNGFNTVPDIQLQHDFVANITGRGFSATPELYGGGIVSGAGFAYAPTISAISSHSITVLGRGFATIPVIGADAPESISVTGATFGSGLYYSRITGRGFAQNPEITAEFTADYAEAFVMNLLTNAVTRYQNYPFSHISRIGDNYYGIKSDGIYLLTGKYDTTATTAVNGTAHGKAHDFGEFNSHNTPYMYVNGDDDYTITPYVDKIEQPSFSSGFSGRRVKLARGNKGRYWSFKIEGIYKLQGVEFMPDTLSRRVK